MRNSIVSGDKASDGRGRKPSENASFRLAFRGFLAVRLMEFDYGGKHYSYHGHKLENAIERLTADGGPRRASTAELVVWGQAVHDWRQS